MLTRLFISHAPHSPSVACYRRGPLLPAALFTPPPRPQVHLMRMIELEPSIATLLSNALSGQLECTPVRDTQALTPPHP